MMAVVGTAVGESDCTPHLHQFCDVVGEIKHTRCRMLSAGPQDHRRIIIGIYLSVVMMLTS